MDHVVYLDAKANELELLLTKQKSMLFCTTVTKNDQKIPLISQLKLFQK